MQAGLRTGDIITRIDGVGVDATTSLEEVSGMVSKTQTGQVELELERPGMAKTMKIRAQARAQAMETPSVPLAFTARSPAGSTGYMKLKDMGPSSSNEAEVERALPMLVR